VTSATKRSEAPPRTTPGRATLLPVKEERAALLADRRLRGIEFGRAYSALIDPWIASLLGDEPKVAIVAVGGYGRRELAPGSDLDILLVHDGVKGVGEIADRLWYPIWDAGFALDHSVRTPTEALRIASDDLKVALGLLDARTIGGSGELGDRLIRAAREQWRARSRKWCPDLERSVQDRRDRLDSVAFVLEPDLKDGAGGLRDATIFRGLAVAFPVEPSPELEAAAASLFAARVELQRASGRREDRLLLEYQDEVASLLDDFDADALMRRIAACGRTISWHLDDAWRTARSMTAGPRRRSAARGDVPLEPGIVLRDGELTVTGEWAVAEDDAIVLRVAALSARRRLPIARMTLRRLAEEAPRLDGRWSDDARAALVDLLGAGHDAVAVFETLDQYDLVARILPEWAAVRSRPQRNAFHRFTVDRHLVEAAAQAAPLAGRVARPDLLLIGALLHDLGKGSPGDHTDAGIALARVVATRMGYEPDDVETLVAMVRYHLLLPSVATSRDLDLPETITGVATAISSPELLDLLETLTEADSLATGPTAWNPWKAGLVSTLAERVRARLTGTPHVHGPALPSADEALMARADGELLVEGGPTHVVVVAPDQPGLFSRVVGLLALDGHDVRAARAASIGGMAMSEYDLEPNLGEAPDWSRFEERLRAALEQETPLDPALSERADRYGRLQRPQAARLAPPKVIFDNDATTTATVLEVHAPDEIGVLHRIARTLADLSLDIRHAKVSTLGPEVIDTFYVVDANGEKLVELGERERAAAAILGAVERDGGTG
jgi:[protein-PII] uridylyltransferase